MIETCIKIIKEGGNLDFDQAMELAHRASLTSLCNAAAKICREVHGKGFDLCSIINARSGRCSEDCRYCAQSVHYNTDIDSYEQIDVKDAVRQAVANEAHGVKRLSLVTAGRSLNTSQLDVMGSLYASMTHETELKFCASMGFLTNETAKLLVSYGVRRYHCNLEACKQFFPSICTTHTWEEKVETLKIAGNAGMDLCSGGIIGMGESLENRVALAFELRDLGVLSIPVNILSPIKSTPLERIEPISLEDVQQCVALFRFINPRAVIRIAGGRGRFGMDQYSLFAAGANGAIVGDYLTTMGSGVTEDLAQFAKLGFDVPGKLQ